MVVQALKDVWVYGCIEFRSLNRCHVIHPPPPPPNTLTAIFELDSRMNDSIRYLTNVKLLSIFSAF